MSYKYRSRRSARSLASKSKQRFIISLVVIIFLIYATLNWILPYFIGGVGALKNIIKPPQTRTPELPQNASLAPPVLNIPYEATNSASIDISGFATPNSRVRLYLDDKPIQTIDVSSKGDFIFANIELYLGTNNLYSTTLDEKEKESLASKTIRLIFDNEKPNLNIKEPEDLKIIQGGDKKTKVSGKTNPGAQILVNSSQVVVDKDGNFNTDIDINEGDNIISIKATDTASNSNSAERTVIYKP